MDFVIKLSKSKNSTTQKIWDNIPVMVDKLTKYIFMIPSKKNYKTDQFEFILLKIKNKSWYTNIHNIGQIQVFYLELLKKIDISNRHQIKNINNIPFNKNILQILREFQKKTIKYLFYQ